MRSSCQDSCLKEGHVLTFVVVCCRVESCQDVEFLCPPFSLCSVAPCYKIGSYLDTVFIRRYAGCLSRQRSVPSSTKALSTGMRQIGEICQALYTEAVTSFCQTYDGAMCSNLPWHHCLLPPHVVEDCTVLLTSPVPTS